MRGINQRKIEGEDYQFKRLLLKEELDQVYELIKDAPEFTEHYPKFENWLENALEEVSAGDRFAFGLLKPLAADGHANLSIIGVAIVKPTEPFAELKTLYLVEKYRNQGYGQVLYQNVEEQLVKRGIIKIITDVPHDMKETCLFLLKQGFQINGLVERYKKGDLNYILSKGIFPYYTGDPFDLFGLSEWFLENIHNFEIYDIKDIDNKSRLLRFNLNKNLDETLPRDGLTRIEGLSIIHDGIIEDSSMQPIIKLIEKENPALFIVIARDFEINSKQSLVKERVLLFDENQLYTRELTGIDKPSFRKEDIEGIIVEVKDAYFERMNEGESFVYFRSGRMGRYLKTGDYIVFFVDSCRESPYGAIKGIGTIRECSLGEPAEQWSKYANLNPKFRKEEFDSYSKYKKAIVALVVEDFRKTSIIEYADVRKMLQSKLNVTDVGSCYLNKGAVKDILCHIASKLKNNALGKLAEQKLPSSDMDKESCKKLGKAHFGIITIKEEEYLALLKHFENRKTFRGKNRDYECCEITTKQGNAVCVCLTRCLHQGQGEAQAVTEDLLDDHSPQWILLVGIAGGVPDYEYSLGDVLLASKLVDFSISAVNSGETQYDVDGSRMHKEVDRLLGNFPAKYSELENWNSEASLGYHIPPIPIPEGIDADILYGDESHRTKVFESLKKNFPNGIGRLPKCRIATMASANLLIKDTDLLKEWKDSARSISGVEMELGGVYRAIRRHGDIPVLAIRSLSDIVGLVRDPEWTNYACCVAGAFTRALIQSGVIDPSLAFS